MTTKTYLITGANRGIGLALVRHVLARDASALVIAAVRVLDRADKGDELGLMEQRMPGRLERVQMDVSDAKSVARAAEACSHLCFAKRGIDVLICNAGLAAGSWAGPLGDDAVANISTNLTINTVGTAATVDAFLPLLRVGRAKQIWLASSNVACLGGEVSGGAAAAPYAASKAALNMWGVKLARALLSEGFSVVMYHPGWTRTRMGGPNADLDPDEAVPQLLATLENKTAADSGCFVDYKGGTLSW